MAAKLNDAVASLKATITDANGQIIDTLDLGPASSGVTDFFWDGSDSQGNKVAAGTYKLQLSAKDLQGKEVTPSTYVGAQVASVATASDPGMLPEAICSAQTNMINTTAETMAQ